MRALAALKLVQEQVRYLALTMDNGGYVPAAADLTWSRRFGDCKGKTVMLLALLHELGIEARPALVSTQGGDGLEARLPMAGLFDHVIVQATIGGRTYWLDGTRPGDHDLERIRTPAFHWALPVTDAGSELVKLEPAALTVPQRVTSLDMDASAGIDIPAPVKAEMRFEDDAALVLRFGFAQLAAAERERALKDYWHREYDFITPTSVALIDEPTTGAIRLTMTGTARMDWSSNDGTRWYELDGARLGAKMDTARDPGPDREAPFATDYPDWQQWRETIHLPHDGKGFVLDGGNLDRTIGPFTIHSKVTIDGATLTMVASSRTTAPEIVFAQADAMRDAMSKLYDRGVNVRPPLDYKPSAAELAVNPDAAGPKLDKPAAAFKQAQALFDRNEMPGRGPRWKRRSRRNQGTRKRTGCSRSCLRGWGMRVLSPRRRARWCSILNKRWAGTHGRSLR